MWLLGLIAGLGCSADEEKVDVASGAETGDGFLFGEDTPGIDPGTDPERPTCLGQTREAETIGLDIYVMLDISGSMLDVLPVRVPSAILQRASSAGTAGRASGAFTMGAMSGLVAAPCSAPVMAAVLTWVSSTKSAALGFLYLFVFSLGMCTLLVVVGLSSGAIARLPRAGMWMVWVKRLFAVVMIGVAEYYLVKMGQLIL